MKNFLYTIKFLSIAVIAVPGILSAQKNSEKGDRYYDQNQFEMAIKYYQMDISSHNKKVSEYALQKMANCYRISGEFEKAEETFKKIARKKKKDPLSYLNYGLALKNSAKFAEAIVQFDEYIKMKPEDPMGKVFRVSCDSAQTWLDETIGKEVKNLESINTPLSEFSPVILNNEDLYFSSSRIGSTKALISLDGGGDINRLDLYNIKLNDIEDKEAKKVKLVNLKDINTALHEGSACFSADGNEIYFTKTIRGKRDRETNEILGTLQVYYSKKDTAGKWTKPVSAFDFNSMNYSVGHPSLSQDGKTIYYMSDKPGGYGKTDIYYSVKTAKNTWSAPINAGNEINTFGHELFPNIASNGILFFSSNAHPGMGQLDIFKAAYVNGKWTNIRNLKPPINSIANDFGIALEGENMRGFFSSDRFNGKGAEDIYSFSDDVPLAITLSNDSVYLKDYSIFDDIKYSLTNETDSSEVDLDMENGDYYAQLTKNKNYKLKATKFGMKYNEVRISFQKNESDSSVVVDLASSDKEIHVSGKFCTGKTVAAQLKYAASLDTSVTDPKAPATSAAPTENELQSKGYFIFETIINPSEQKTLRSNEIPVAAETKEPGL